MQIEVEDGRIFSVDTLTGEVLGEYTASLHTDVELKKDARYTSTTLLNPYTARNEEQIREYIKEMYDGRKLFTINNTRHYHDLNCGEVVRSGAKNQFTLPCYNVMSKLVGSLTIHNVIITNRENLCLVLGCTTEHLKRTLKVCGDLVKYETKGMQRGFVRVFINPAYGWKAESSIAHASQQKAIIDWYKFTSDPDGVVTVNIEGNKPFKISPQFDDWLSRLHTSVSKKYEGGIPDDY